MVAFLVEFLFSSCFSCFLDHFLGRVLVFFFKFPPQLLINGYEMPPVKAENIVSDSRWRFIQYPVINYASSIEDRILPAEDFFFSPYLCVIMDECNATGRRVFPAPQSNVAEILYISDLFPISQTRREGHIFNLYLSNLSKNHLIC